MKLPKELKNKPKTKTKNKKEQVYATFKRMFNQLNKTYLPHYSVIFLKMGQKGKYSDMVYEWLRGYDNLKQKDFILMAKEYENIEFYVNWERLGKIYLRDNLKYDLDNHFEFYKNLYRQCAYHEYGHTYLTTSTSTMLYPNQVIQFLEDNNIKNIRNIPEDKSAEIKRLFENSKQYQIDKTLKNFNFLDIANGVLECHANWTMRNVLKLKMPTEFLKFSSIDLLDGLYDYSKFDKNEIDEDYINLRIKNWVIKANDLFAYDKLNIMKNSCEKYGFIPLLEFANDLNSKFLEIVKISEDITDMKDEILSLAVETNKLNFKEMFFQ